MLTTDQRILSGNLVKLICDSCGVVSNADVYDDDQLRSFYGQDYRLNTHNHEEHVSFRARAHLLAQRSFTSGFHRSPLFVRNQFLKLDVVKEMFYSVLRKTSPLAFMLPGWTEALTPRLQRRQKA